MEVTRKVTSAAIVLRLRPNACTSNAGEEGPDAPPCSLGKSMSELVGRPGRLCAPALLLAIGNHASTLRRGPLCRLAGRALKSFEHRDLSTSHDKGAQRGESEERALSG
ncbi:MAG: hypothetical protein ACJA2W_003302 [Planctomycetota bacterium]|jgi:hypothetical protein